MSTPKLSVVVPTKNRVDLLIGFAKSVLDYTDLSMGLEFVVVNAQQAQSPEEKLHELLDPVKEVSRVEYFVQESNTLIGAVNEACRRCQGENVFVGNDDALMQDPALSDAVKILDVLPEMGQIAVPYWGPHVYPKLDFFDLPIGRQWYANFGITRRWMGDEVNWWGTTHRHYAGDPELTLKLLNRKWLMFALPGNLYCVHHLETLDDTRKPNLDHQDFFAKWKQWMGPGDTRKEFQT